MSLLGATQCENTKTHPGNEEWWSIPKEENVLLGEEFIPFG